MKPTPYANKYAHDVLKYYIPMGIPCCNVLTSIRIYQIQISQNKARKTPFICPVFSHPVAFSNAVASDAVNGIKATRASALPTANILLVCVGEPTAWAEYGYKDTKKI